MSRIILCLYLDLCQNKANHFSTSLCSSATTVNYHVILAIISMAFSQARKENEIEMRWQRDRKRKREGERWERHRKIQRGGERLLHTWLSYCHEILQMHKVHLCISPVVQSIPQIIVIIFGRSTLGNAPPLIWCIETAPGYIQICYWGHTEWIEKCNS